MKKNLLKTVFAICCIPILLLSGCQNKSTYAIDLKTYFKNQIQTVNYQVEGTSTDSIDVLIASKPDMSKLSKYVKFEMTAESVWMYKMYVEYITFYVYTNESTDSEFIVNLEMSNLIDEDVLYSAINADVTPETIKKQCSFIPQKNNSQQCRIEIGKTVASATGPTTLSLDITNSASSLFATKDGENNFKWIIYGLEIHGESRSYNKK